MMQQVLFWQRAGVECGWETLAPDGLYSPHCAVHVSLFTGYALPPMA